MSKQKSQVIFVSNPFHGNINPGTGSRSKIFLKASAKLDKDNKVEVKIATTSKFLDQATKDTNNFGWSPFIMQVQSGANGFKNLLKEHKDMSLEDMKRQAYKS